MEATPWSISSTKRKRSPKPLPPHKRPRHSDSGGNGSTARKNVQQTLTQVQWATPQAPTSMEEDVEIGESRRATTAPPKMRRLRLKKQDSTLTQMDFFSCSAQKKEDFDDAPIGGGYHGTPALSMPQLDGTYTSPRKPRKRRSSTNRRGRGSTTPRPESQDHKPGASKSAITTVKEEAPRIKRNSARLALKSKILSDPNENLEYFEKALSSPPAGSRRDISSPTTSRQLAEAARNAPKQQPLNADPPRTPQKNRTVILSSETPESIPPSTDKRQRKTPWSQRSALAELSANLGIPRAHSLSEKTAVEMKGQTLTRENATTANLHTRKRCQRPPVVEDSQADPWDLPSSLPSPSKNADRHQSQREISTKTISQELEIPCSSQVQAVTPSPPASSNKSQHGGYTAMQPPGLPISSRKDAPSRGGGLVAENLVHTDVSMPCQDDEMNLEAGKSTDEAGHERSGTPGPVCKAIMPDPDQGDDFLSDLGSPVMNDSQFNLEVQQRTSSPSTAAGMEGVRTRSSPASSGSSLTTRAVNLPQFKIPAQVAAGAVGHSDESQRPLPTPRLVQTSSPAALVNRRTESAYFDLLEPSSGQGSSIHVSTLQVPLNDVMQHSSSQSLPTIWSGGHKGVQPASLPRVSQISTQEPTQAFGQPSSTARPFYYDEIDEHSDDKFTIKDSSSMQVPLSQLPQFQESQYQRRVNPGLDEVPDSEDEDGDDDEDEVEIDLDPSSLPPRVRRKSPQEMSLPPLAAAGPAQSDDIPSSQQETESVDPDTNPVQKASQHPALKVEESAEFLERHQTPRHWNAHPASSSPMPSPRSPQLTPLKEKHDPIPGFDNDTQSNFTQGGHVTAAFIHRQREKGILPDWYTPKPYQIPGYTRWR